jgi:hypothetical protein
MTRTTTTAPSKTNTTTAFTTNTTTTNTTTTTTINTTTKFADSSNSSQNLCYKQALFIVTYGFWFFLLRKKCF